jgi:N-acetylmuramoyl-L-alanine amidase
MARITTAVLAFALFAFAADPHAAHASSATGRTTAVDLFARAEEAFTALKNDARAQRQRQNFTRVLESYRGVFEKYPSTPQAERSLLRAGELQTLLFRWTGQEGDLNRAQHYYQRLILNYPKSPLAADARLAIAYLYLDHYKDPAAAWLRFRDVTAGGRAGTAAEDARRQLARLARYAPVEPASKPSQGEASAPQSVPTRTPAPTAAPASPSVPPPATNRIRDIRHWSNPEYSRVVIHLEQKTNFYSNLLEDRSGEGRPPRLYIDLFNTLVEERFTRPIGVNDGILRSIRAGRYTSDSVRVVLDIDGLSTYRIFPMSDPFRIVIDVTGGTPAAVPDVSPASEPAEPLLPQTAPPTSALIPATPRSGPDLVPEIIPLPPMGDHASPPTETPAPPATPTPPAATTAPLTAAGTEPVPIPPAEAPAPKVTVPKRVAPAASQAAPQPARTTVVMRTPAPPPAPGKLSLAQQLGLGVRRVVIDAGHGAHDPGAIGVGGLQEKEVTLDLALLVREALQTAGYEVVLTRDRDVYLPLEERTALANTTRGDLFLSLHCNASDNGKLNGVETYYLNLASSRRAMATAARENSMALANMSDLQDLLKQIYDSKMDESSRFADAVQRSLHGSLRRAYRDVKDLGVKQAPFYVLIGAQMPSVLVEVSFINHDREGRRLAQPAYRRILAQAIADGVKRYVRTVKTAGGGAPVVPTP